MTIAIDIGNSTIGFGFLKGGHLERVVKIEHEPESELVRVKLDNFLQHAADKHAIDRVIICSVVPDTLKALTRKIRLVWKVRPDIIGRDIAIPIVNKYRSPRQVGKDRLLCAFAARLLYGAPAVVIDLGTAITFDGISPEGEYLGGAIVPGIRLSVEALFEKTALLPRVRIAEPRKVIGRSTEESIQSGIFHGFGSLCDGMVERLGLAMKCTPQVIVTGGYGEIMSKYMATRVTAVDDGLIYKGMALLAAEPAH